MNASSLQAHPLVVALSQGANDHAAALLNVADSQAPWNTQWLDGLVNASAVSCTMVDCSGFADCASAALSFLDNELAKDRANVCENATAEFKVQTECIQYTSGQTAASVSMSRALQEAKLAFTDAVWGNATSIAGSSTGTAHVWLCGRAHVCHYRNCGTGSASVTFDIILANVRRKLREVFKDAFY